MSSCWSMDMFLLSKLSPLKPLWYFLQSSVSPHLLVFLSGHHGKHTLHWSYRCKEVKTWVEAACKQPILIEIQSGRDCFRWPSWARGHISIVAQSSDCKAQPTGVGTVSCNINLQRQMTEQLCSLLTAAGVQPSTSRVLFSLEASGYHLQALHTQAHTP